MDLLLSVIGKEFMQSVNCTVVTALFIQQILRAYPMYHTMVTDCFMNLYTETVPYSFYVI